MPFPEYTLPGNISIRCLTEYCWSFDGYHSKKGSIATISKWCCAKKGSSKSFQTLSGGEKRKVRIACSLALQDLVSNRASKNIDLFIGDEIDDALDTAGLERLMGILESKARERGTVLIISHKEMKSWFRETITLEVKRAQLSMIRRRSQFLQSCVVIGKTDH
ncbi:hypothetical protein DJICPGNB_25920 [Escherichia coli]|nr:hypothetical protein DJICPGNB_25920 [Escherichia coli]